MHLHNKAKVSEVGHVIYNAHGSQSASETRRRRTCTVGGAGLAPPPMRSSTRASSASASAISSCKKSRHQLLQEITEKVFLVFEV